MNQVSPVFPSRANLKLYNISLTPKLVKKVKVSGPDCIPEEVRKNCEIELSYILAELFNMFLKEYCFQSEGLIGGTCI